MNCDNKIHVTLTYFLPHDFSLFLVHILPAFRFYSASGHYWEYLSQNRRLRSSHLKVIHHPHSNHRRVLMVSKPPL